MAAMFPAHKEGFQAGIGLEAEAFMRAVMREWTDDMSREQMCMTTTCPETGKRITVAMQFFAGGERFEVSSAAELARAKIPDAVKRDIRKVMDW